MDTISDRTTGRIAREAGVTPATVRLYADMGLIAHRVASDGTRLFSADAAQAVRDILAQRLANRGRRRPEGQAVA
jgi:DNA-binding transcriptional MerR regulator